MQKLEVSLFTAFSGKAINKINSFRQIKPSTRQQLMVNVRSISLLKMINKMSENPALVSDIYIVVRIYTLYIIQRLGGDVKTETNEGKVTQSADNIRNTF